jgi:hypothetical protein
MVFSSLAPFGSAPDVKAYKMQRTRQGNSFNRKRNKDTTDFISCIAVWSLIIIALYQASGFMDIIMAYVPGNQE